ncbi:MAG: tRNA-binding protein [Acidimicrobiaceae bacterium]|jgi:tRNA-binding protein
MVDRTAPQKQQITAGKFQNVDLRVAKVLSAPPSEGTRHPGRVMRIDLGHLGERTSIGQFALIPEEDLVGRHVVACINLGSREMGPYVSDALVLGAPHPASPPDEAQATPVFLGPEATPGDPIF